MLDVKEKISDIVLENKNSLINDRRYIHKNPELSFKEYETSNYIKQRLDEMSVNYISGLIGTDVIAVIEGTLETGSNKTLLIRADMDALPVCETKESEYASVNNGVMHACGHDVHTAILLCVCDVLNKMKECFSGTVKLVFQPGEETSGGAKPLIDAGILVNPNVDACVALHVDPDIDCGKIRVKKGPLYASPDDFFIKVIGKGGHGAEPHNCIDPIAVSAKIIEALLTLPARELNPFEQAVVTIGTVNAGNASNIIPDSSIISGTARSLNNEVRSFLKKRIGEIANGICSTYGAKCEYKFVELFPPLINDTDLAELFCKTAKRIIGEENCILGGQPTMAGEDFAFFANERPSLLFKLGCKNEDKDIIYPIHNSMFDIDESALTVGVELFSNFAIDFLNQ